MTCHTFNEGIDVMRLCSAQIDCHVWMDLREGSPMKTIHKQMNVIGSARQRPLVMTVRLSLGRPSKITITVVPIEPSSRPITVTRNGDRSTTWSMNRNTLPRMSQVRTVIKSGRPPRSAVHRQRERVNTVRSHHRNTRNDRPVPTLRKQSRSLANKMLRRTRRSTRNETRC